MPQIIPSIASADPLCLSREMERVKGTRLHLDIEDGCFVPNITFGMKTIRAISRETNAMLDAHLLVLHPRDYLDDLRDCGVKKTAVHIEATRYPADILNAIRHKGMEAGLALNFITSPEQLLPFIDCLDYVIIMTAEPDDNHQSFCPAMLPKIKRAREILPKRVSVWVDGGIGEDQFARVVESGADTIIMGRAIFLSNNPSELIARLEKE